MARGNKFKPQPVPQLQQEVAAGVPAAGATLAQVDAPVLAGAHASRLGTAAQQNGAHEATVAQDSMHQGKRKKKNKSQRRRASAEQQANGAAPAQLTSNIARQVQQRQQQQEQQQQQGQGTPEDGSQQPPRKKRKLKAGGASGSTEKSTPGAEVVASGPGAVPGVGKPAVAAAFPTLVVPVPPKSATAAGVGSNWAALKTALAQQQQHSSAGGGKRGRQRGQGVREGAEEDATQEAKPGGKLPSSMGSDQGLTKVLAIDCEMVGVGPDGTRSALARVCVVNSVGNVVLDSYVRPLEAVTDYRTKVSGIRPSHLAGAPDFESVQKRVGDALKGRVVVGHAITNDLKVLLLGHPRKDIRDTSRYPPLMRTQGSKLRPRALRLLAQEQLGLTIQAGEHNPVDDARACLYLYLKHRKDWERWLAQGGKPPSIEPFGGPARVQKALNPHPARHPCATKMMTLEQLAQDDYMADL
ncbi:hypothetical protein N2152v2_004099 [Parachlorella kessleri]